MFTGPFYHDSISDDLLHISNLFVPALHHQNCSGSHLHQSKIVSAVVLTRYVASTYAESIKESRSWAAVIRAIALKFVAVAIAVPSSVAITTPGHLE